MNNNANCIHEKVCKYADPCLHGVGNLSCEYYEEANDRQCEKCRHKVETKPGVEACDVWDCSFEPKDEQS